MTSSIGHVDAWIFLADLAECLGRDIYDDADAHDGETESLAALLYKFEPSPLDEAFSSRNALYLHHIYLRPEFRGADIGRQVIRGCLLFHNVANVGCVLLCVDSKFDLPPGDPLAAGTRAAGDKKLSKLYRSMGFKPFGDSGYMYANPELKEFWTAMELER